MILIVGLGNPGEVYKKTLHNIGFRALDFFSSAYFPRGEWEKDRESELFTGEINGESIIFQKPLTYMNNSGIAVKNVMKTYSIEDYTHCWVIHDDLDLSWGRVKIEKEKNAAGHKGVQSIIDALGANNFWRFRVGVRPEVYPFQKKDINAYLTEKSIPQSKHALEAIIYKEVASLIFKYIKEGITKGDFSFTVNG